MNNLEIREYLKSKSQKLSTTGLYPLVDPHPLNRTPSGYQITGGQGNAPGAPLRARWTGEKRPPKKGEWYLSGAIIEAYQAENDLTTPFHIAKIVQVEAVQVIQITPVGN